MKNKNRRNTVLIVSTNRDTTINKVIDWIVFHKHSFYRLNIDAVSLFSNNIHSYQLWDEKARIVSNAGTLSPLSVWFRKNPSLTPISNYNKQVNSGYYHVLSNNLKSEYSDLKNAIFNFLSAKACIKLGNHKRYSLNKLLVLEKAQDCLLRIPATLVTNSKKELIAFKKQHSSIIVKPISDLVIIQEGGKRKDKKAWAAVTRSISDEDINRLPAYFSFSLFQKKIDKLFDIRIFYLSGQLYSMAIFSNQTDYVDSRVLGSINRHVPYKLPEIEAKKIRRLMKLLKLNTGSIDMLKDINGDFVFLEVNPVGQYDPTSVYCNYYIEEKIFKYLANDKKANLA